MKTIMIERVSNGWIVRPFNPVPSWACGGSTGETPVVAVYTKMEDLQADLPRLMEQLDSIIENLERIRST